MCPASTATSVPAPIAIPMSAVARAGASFTPSPTIATFLPCAWSSFTLDRLILGEHLGEDRVDPQLLGDRARHRLRAAGEHRHLDPRSCRALIASRLSSRMTSATAKTATALPSRIR